MQNAELGMRNNTGLTLLELLIAITIFAFLASILAGLVKVSLDLWKGSERQGNVVDRQQIVLEYLKKDLEGVSVELETRELVKNIVRERALPGYPSVDEPGFYGDIDQNGNHWLYLVRIAPDTNTTKVYEFIEDFVPAKKLQRIFYYFKPDTGLYRAEVDKSYAETYFKDRRYESGEFPVTDTALAFDDVLYFGLKFLTTDTSQADLKWNSLPMLSPEASKPASPENVIVPEQYLPRAVEVEIVLKPTVFPESVITLNEDGGTTLRTSPLRGLPTPPEFVKLENEWVAYDGLSGNTLRVAQRGARNTKETSHAPNTSVVHGITLKQLFYLPTCGK